MPKRTDIHNILIIGSGPIVISQACEFDYSGTQACKALREEGFRVCLVNSNPATIMTDPEIADATYIEPITVRVLEKIIEKERPDALLPTLGGQTGLNTAMKAIERGILDKYGVKMIGANYDTIKKAEDRDCFKQAMLKIGRRALRGPLHVVLAIGAFVALQFLHVPFPLIVLAAGLIGLVAGAGTAGAAAAVEPAATRAGQPVLVLSVGLGLWVIPLLACGAVLGFESLWSRVYLFFTQAALVTFGGAYAVLGYVTQHLVSDLGWLTAEQAVTGLALAETTPGPLIIVLQFMGFMAGWNQPAPLSPGTAAVLAASLASWATFLPSFVFIFLGAPYVERITAEPRTAGALAAITAAVVGIIGTLALLFARVVLLPNGIGSAPDWATIAIAVAVWLLLMRTRVDLPWILAAAAGAGFLLR